MDPNSEFLREFVSAMRYYWFNYDEQEIGRYDFRSWFINNFPEIPLTEINAVIPK